MTGFAFREFRVAADLAEFAASGAVASVISVVVLGDVLILFYEEAA